MRQGRPKDGPEDKFSLKQVVPRLSECLGSTVRQPPTDRSEHATTHCRSVWSDHHISRPRVLQAATLVVPEQSAGLDSRRQRMHVHGRFTLAGAACHR